MGASLDRLHRVATKRGITPPTKPTLAKYGIDEEYWLATLERQGWKCPICLKRAGVKWNIDHAHVPGWKKMAPAERRRFVRGILCAFCNHRRVNSNMSSNEAQRIADYFRDYEQRGHLTELTQISQDVEGGYK